MPATDGGSGQAPSIGAAQIGGQVADQLVGALPVKGQARLALCPGGTVERAKSVWEFERSLLEALAIVLAVSFLFLGWRTGIVVAASVPLVLALVAAVMYAAG